MSLYAASRLPRKVRPSTATLFTGIDRLEHSQSPDHRTGLDSEAAQPYLEDGASFGARRPTEGLQFILTRAIFHPGWASLDPDGEVGTTNPASKCLSAGFRGSLMGTATSSVSSPRPSESVWPTKLDEIKNLRAEDQVGAVSRSQRHA